MSDIASQLEAARTLLLPSLTPADILAFQNGPGLARYGSYVDNGPGKMTALRYQLDSIADPITRIKIALALLCVWNGDAPWGEDYVAVYRQKSTSFLNDLTGAIEGGLKKDDVDDLGVQCYTIFNWAVQTWQCPTLPWFPAPCPADKHIWSAAKRDGNCQLCGVVNNEPRIFVSFLLSMDPLGVIDDQDAPIVVQFSCLPAEWDAFHRCVAGENLDCLPNDQITRAFEWIQNFRLPDFTDKDNTVAWEEKHTIHHLEVVRDPTQVELLIKTTHVPRATPRFIKWMIQSECEAGEEGRCFCDDSRPCTVGRSCRAPAAGKARIDRQDQDRQDQDQEDLKNRSRKRKSDEQGVELTGRNALLHAEVSAGRAQLQRMLVDKDVTSAQFHKAGERLDAIVKRAKVAVSEHLGEFRPASDVQQ